MQTIEFRKIRRILKPQTAYIWPAIHTRSSARMQPTREMIKIRGLQNSRYFHQQTYYVWKETGQAMP